MSATNNHKVSPGSAGHDLGHVNSVDGTIQRKRANGAGEAETLFTGVDRNATVWDVSPDGQYVLYNDRDLMVLPLTGDRKPRPHLASKATRYEAAFAPDGRWVAYASGESGRSEIYVQGFPQPRGKWLVSAEGAGYRVGARMAARSIGCVRTAC